MEFLVLQDIVDYAIEKEQEAVNFYNDLAGDAKKKALAEELHKMALMEQGHKERLEKMDAEEAAKKMARPVQDLKIADYLIDIEPGPNMNWQDIIQLAMKRELAAKNLYTDLAKLVSEPAAKQMFENLAADENAHKLYFEKIWDDEIMKEM